MGRLIRAPHLHSGGFILIPNPKFHEEPSVVATIARDLRSGHGNIFFNFRGKIFP